MLSERSRAVRKAATRARILDAARESSETVGYEGTNLRAVAQVAGVSTGAILGHFADKQDLLHAALFDDLERTWAEARATARGRSLERDLAKIAETLKAIADAAKWPTLHVPVDFLSQIDGGTPRAASSDCDDACQQMMEETSNVGNRVTPRHGNDNVIECGDNNAKGTKEASDYLFGQLKAGKPVMIGVDYKEGTGRSNVNDIDHYLVVTGSGVDKQGRQYLTFNDPQQSNARLGTDANPANRLYKMGGEFKQLDAEKGQTPYELRGVVRND